MLYLTIVMLMYEIVLLYFHSSFLQINHIDDIHFARVLRDILIDTFIIHI